MEQQPRTHDPYVNRLPPPNWETHPATAPRGPTDALATHSVLSVTQKKEWTEILTGWETKNRYEISSRQGELLFHAGELPGSTLARLLLKNKRPFTIELRDPQGELFITVKRPWRWFFARADVFDAQGNLLGAIQRRWAWFSRKYSLEDATGQEFAELQGPLFRPWTFHITVDGDQEGVISKKWSGALKEMFTDADNFGITFGPRLPVEIRPLCLGATFLIDFEHFENTSNN